VALVAKSGKPTPPRQGGFQAMMPEGLVDKITKTIRELWSGDVPLCPAFWIFGFTVVLGFKWVMRAMTAYGYSGHQSYLVVGAMSVLYAAFATVSVWRSASKFKGNKALAFVARLGVIVWPSSIFWGP